MSLRCPSPPLSIWRCSISWARPVTREFTGFLADLPGTRRALDSSAHAEGFPVAVIDVPTPHRAIRGKPIRTGFLRWWKQCPHGAISSSPETACLPRAALHPWRQPRNRNSSCGSTNPAPGQTSNQCVRFRGKPSSRSVGRGIRDAGVFQSCFAKGSSTCSVPIATAAAIQLTASIPHKRLRRNTVRRRNFLRSTPRVPVFHEDGSVAEW